MPELILENRITSKKVPENIISRQKLLEKLDGSKQKNLIIIESPAGYGKTTLVQDFLSNSGLDYCWYHVTEDVNNFYTFFSYITHSIKKLDKNFGANTLEVIESLKQNTQLSKDIDTAVTTVLGTFINEFLNHFKKDVYLVLDDLHNAGDSKWLNRMFKSLTEDFPDNLHIIITTRVQPQFDLSRLTAKRNLLQIGVKDLYFDKNEILLLLEKIYSINFRGKDINIFEKKINGWITGIHLILQAYGDDFNKVKFEKDALPENIFYFFANDIFNGLDDETKSFLINTALLENFTPDACNDIFKITGSAEITEQLLRKNIFIESSELSQNGTEKKLTYNYHTLFKQFLLAKLKEMKTDEEIRTLNKTIYTYYRNINDRVSAIKYSLNCGECEEAVTMIIKEFPALFDDLHYQTLWDWISSVPEEQVLKNPLIMLYKGRLLKNFRGEMDSALSYFRNCSESDLIKNDENLLTECYSQIIDILIAEGKPDKAQETLKGMLNTVKEPENTVRFNLMFSRVKYRLGPQEYDEIIKILTESLKICEENGFKHLQNTAYNLLGNIYNDRGEFVKSSFYYEQVIKNERNIFRRYLVLTNIIPLLSFSCNYQKAKEYLDEAVKLFHTYPSALLERYLLRASAFFRFEAGDYEECFKLFEKLINFEEKNGLYGFIFWYYILIGEAYSFLEKNLKALQMYELASKYQDTNDEYEKIELELHRAVIQKKNNMNPAIEKKFLNTLKYYDSNGYVYNKAQIEFHLADYYFKSGATDTTLKYLTSSLFVSSEKQYVSFLEQNFTGFRYLFDLAYQNGIEKNFITGLRINLLDRLNFGWLSEECRQRLLIETDCLYDIKLTSFGSIEISVRGNPVTEDKWVRKKSKLILVYLMLNPGEKFTKDKMMDLFFRELSVESAENIFHQSITNIRNCVKPYEISSIVLSPKDSGKKTRSSKSKKSSVISEAEPSFIIYEDKILRLNPDFNYKTDALDFDLLYHKAKSAESNNETKEHSAREAIRIYKGEFLAGQYDLWCEELREEYSNKYIDLCEELIGIYKKKKMYFETSQYAEHLLKVDKLNENTYIDLIEALVSMGNLNAAKNKFSQMLKIFEEEYGEKPSKTALDKIKNLLM